MTRVHFMCVFCLLSVWHEFICVFQEMIQLEGIPNLSGLVQSFDQQQLANFCRILSVTISEPDVGNDDKHTLLAKNAQQKRNASPSRAEVNQGGWSSECTGQALLHLCCCEKDGSVE